jgi:hypothetical protein
LLPHNQHTWTRPGLLTKNWQWKLDKLNRCLSEIDTLSRVKFDYDNVIAEIGFNCFTGGQYEDVDLVLKPDDPYYYSMLEASRLRTTLKT